MDNSQDFIVRPDNDINGQAYAAMDMQIEERQHSSSKLTTTINGPPQQDLTREHALTMYIDILLYTYASLQVIG